MLCQNQLSQWLKESLAIFKAILLIPPLRNRKATLSKMFKRIRLDEHKVSLVLNGCTYDVLLTKAEYLGQAHCREILSHSQGVVVTRVRIGHVGEGHGHSEAVSVLALARPKLGKGSGRSRKSFGRIFRTLTGRTSATTGSAAIGLHGADANQRPRAGRGVGELKRARSKPGLLSVVVETNCLEEF